MSPPPAVQCAPPWIYISSLRFLYDFYIAKPAPIPSYTNHVPLLHRAYTVIYRLRSSLHRPYIAPIPSDTASIWILNRTMPSLYCPCAVFILSHTVPISSLHRPIPSLYCPYTVPIATDTVPISSLHRPITVLLPPLYRLFTTNDCPQYKLVARRTNWLSVVRIARPQYKLIVRSTNFVLGGPEKPPPLVQCAPSNRPCAALYPCQIAPISPTLPSYNAYTAPYKISMRSYGGWWRQCGDENAEPNIKMIGDG